MLDFLLKARNDVCIALANKASGVGSRQEIIATKLGKMAASWPAYSWLCLNDEKSKSLSEDDEEAISCSSACLFSTIRYPRYLQFDF